MNVQAFLDFQAFHFPEVEYSGKFSESLVLFPVLVIEIDSIRSESDFYRGDIVQEAVDLDLEIFHRFCESGVFFLIKGCIFQGNLQRAEQGLERVFRTQLFSPLALKFVHPSLVILSSGILVH